MYKFITFFTTMHTQRETRTSQWCDDKQRRKGVHCTRTIAVTLLANSRTRFRRRTRRQRAAQYTSVSDVIGIGCHVPGNVLKPLTRTVTKVKRNDVSWVHFRGKERGRNRCLLERLLVLNMYIRCEEDPMVRDKKQKKENRKRLNEMCPRMRTLLEYVTLSCSLALGAICRGCHALVRNSRATHARFRDFTNATSLTLHFLLRMMTLIAV